MDAMYYKSYPYNAYPYGPMYFPDPWRTTVVPHHFPEHHHLFERSRHSIGDTMSKLGHSLLHPYDSEPPIYNPKADVLESEVNYYVDVELPGIEHGKEVKLTWLSAHTLLISATSKRCMVDEDVAESRDATTDTGIKTGGLKNGDLDDENKNKESINGLSHEKHKSFLTLNERIVGKFGRAFNFPAAVEHHKLKYTLSGGVFRIVVPKVVEDIELNKGTGEKPDVGEDKEAPAANN